MVSLMGIQSGDTYMKNNQVIEKYEKGAPTIYLDGKFTEWELIEFIDSLRKVRQETYVKV